MQRRALLRGVVGLTGLTGLAGCGSFGETSAPEVTRTAAPPTPDAEGEGRSTPYRAEAPEENLYRARSITVVNERTESQYVTIAVDDDEREIAVRSANLAPGTRITHFRLVAKRGVYRVTVDTAASDSVVREFVVHEGVSDMTAVVTDGGIETRQEARCWPDCPPLSTGGFVGDFPRPETTVRWRGLGQVLVRNDDTRARQVRIRLWAADEEEEVPRRLLDYRYRVPAGMRLVLPLVRRGGRYELAVATETTEARRVWHVPEESVAEFSIGEAVTPVCDLIRGRATETYGPFRLGGVRNDDDVAHTVTVTVDNVDGRFTETYTVQPGERVGVDFQTAAGDDVRLTARTDAGAELVATWTHCPPAGYLVLTIDGRGRLRGYSDRQGLVAE